MNRTAIAAAALAGATALTGASVSSSAAPSTEAKAPHVLKWKWHAIADHEIGGDTIVGTHAIRSQRSNNIIGYSSFTGGLLPAHNGLKVQAAAAVKDGVIVLRGQAPFSADALTGQVVSGTGKFKGINGTWRLHEAPNNPNVIFVTVRANY